MRKDSIKTLHQSELLTEVVPTISKANYNNDKIKRRINEHNSGEEIIRSRTGLVGNRQLRAIIIQLSWVAVRKDGALLNKFERVYRSSSCKQKAIVAVARKLMMKVSAVIRKEEEYEINLAA